MKKKTLMILAGVLGIVSILAFFALNQGIWINEPVKIGKKLFVDFPINDIGSIQIISTEGDVQLNRKDDKWVVANKIDYPADFSKIIDLAKKIRDLKIGRKFTASKEAIDRQGLNDPETAEKKDSQTGIRILIKDKAGQKMINLIIGRERESGGHYVMPAKDPNIYLVDKSFAYFDKSPKDWIEKELVNIKEEDISQAVAFDTDKNESIFKLKRKVKGQEPELISPSIKSSSGADDKVKTVDSSKVENIFSLLSPLNIDDVVAFNQKNNQNRYSSSRRLELRLFNNITYKLYPLRETGSESDPPTEGKEDENVNYLIRVEVNYQEPTMIAQSVAADSEKKPDSANLQDLATDAAELNKRLSQWIYEIPKWKYSDIIVELEGIYKTEEKQ